MEIRRTRWFLHRESILTENDWYVQLHLGNPLEASETDDQAFVVVPALDVSIGQKISNMDNIPCL